MKRIYLNSTKGKCYDNELILWDIKGKNPLTNPSFYLEWWDAKHPTNGMKKERSIEKILLPLSIPPLRRGSSAGRARD